MQYFNQNRRGSAVKVLFLLIATAGLLFGVVGCGDDDDSVHITTTSPLPDGTVGQLYTFAFQSDNGGQFWVWQSGEIPPGLRLQTDGTLTGTPITTGTFTMGVTVFQEVIDEFVDPVWYVDGFIAPVPVDVYGTYGVGVESDSGDFTITID